MPYSEQRGYSLCREATTQGVGKTRDGRTSVTVKMSKTRDGTVRDIYVTDP